jgi:CHAT domain-containing protein
MAGFAGSLLAAGAHSIIGSLWSRETSVVSALLNCHLYEELAHQAEALTPGLALWRAAAWLRTASLKDLEDSVADLTKALDKQKQAKALDQLHIAIIEDFHEIVDHAPLRRSRHWAGLIAYGAG